MLSSSIVYPRFIASKRFKAGKEVSKKKLRSDFGLLKFHFSDIRWIQLLSRMKLNHRIYQLSGIISCSFSCSKDLKLHNLKYNLHGRCQPVNIPAENVQIQVHLFRGLQQMEQRLSNNTSGLAHRVLKTQVFLLHWLPSLTSLSPTGES